MSTDEQTFPDHVNANYWAILYRCRWSDADAAHVVPRLMDLLESEDALIRDEALRALFRIGTPAARAASRVAELTRSERPLTKQLAVLTLGQIAHQVPSLCVEPLASVLADPMCCRDAMRALAFIGPKANSALERVMVRFSDSDAKIRKAAVVTAAAIAIEPSEVIEFVERASNDRSKIVREAAMKCLKKISPG